MSEYESNYVANRLRSDRDDRCDDSKLTADAVLRGHLGTMKANALIKMIDDHKSGGKN